MNKRLDGEFVELVEFSDNHYGLLKSEVSNRFGNHEVVVLVAEPEGSQQVREYCDEEGIDFVHVFITNPLQVLMNRWLNRLVNDSKADIAKYSDRIIHMIADEMAWGIKYDYDFTIGRFDQDNEEDIMHYLSKVVEMHRHGIINHALMDDIRPESLSK